MKSFSAKTNIKASAETIWKIRTNASRWTEMITRSIPDLQPAFDQFAADLKRRAERDQ